MPKDNINKKSAWVQGHQSKKPWATICHKLILASHNIHNCEWDDASLAVNYLNAFLMLVSTMSMVRGLCQMVIMGAVLFKSVLMCSGMDIISIT